MEFIFERKHKLELLIRKFFNMKKEKAKKNSGLLYNQNLL